MLIDIQKGLDELDFYGGHRNNLDAEKNAARILKKWRHLKLPLVHVQHASQNPDSPLHPSKPGFEIKDEVKPLSDETVLTKNVNSAFIGTELKSHLDEQDISRLMVVGLTTNHCVSSTVRMAGNLGFKTYLVADATAAFDQVGINGEKFDAELVHQITIANLKDEFADIIDTETALGKW